MPERFVYGRVADFGGFGREPVDIKNGIEVVLGATRVVMPEIVEDHGS